MTDNTLARLQAEVTAELLASGQEHGIERVVEIVLDTAPLRALIQEVDSTKAALERQIADFEALAAHVCPVIEEADGGG